MGCSGLMFLACAEDSGVYVCALGAGVVLYFIPSQQKHVTPGLLII